MAKKIEWLALLLVVVGAVNWGLVGLAQFDLVAYLFGGQSAPLSRVVYCLVGLAGLVLLTTRLSGTAALSGSAPLAHTGEAKRHA